MTRFTPYLLLPFLLLTSFTGTAQSAQIEKAYNHLLADELAEAEKAFLAAAKKPATGAEAQLGLSLVASTRMDVENAQVYFREFMRTEKDPVRLNLYHEAFVDPRGDVLSPEALALLKEETKSDYSRLSVLANWAIANHYDLLGQFDEADKYYAKIGTVPTFAITGPFENISESGFAKDFGVLAGAKASSRFTNKNGVEVKWFPGKVLRKGTLNFGQHFSTANAVFYAQSFVDSPKDQAVTLRLGVGGSAKVWVNDELVFAEREERSTNYDAYVFPAKLLKGNNRVLIQVGKTNRTSASFALRVTEAAGKVVSGLTYSNEYKAYPKPTGWTMSREDNPTATGLKARIAANKSRYVDYLALLQLYAFDDRRYAQRATYLEALELYPENTAFLEGLAATLEQLDDDIGASEIRQRLRQNAPTSLTAMNYDLDKARDDEDWLAYEKHLATLKANIRDPKTINEREVELASGRKDVDRLVELINYGFEKWPRDADYTSTKVAVLRQLDQLPDSARAVLETYNADNYNMQIMRDLMSEYEDDGDTDGMLRLNDRKLRAIPDAPGFLSERAGIYEKRKEYDKADETLALVLEQSPYLSYYHKERGDLAARHGTKETAAKHYRSAIALNPYDYDSRSALRDLDGEGGTAFSVFPEKDYYELAANAAGQEDHPNDHSYVVCHDVQQVIHPGGASETRTTLLAKVFNSNGVDAWKEYSISVGNNASGYAEKAEVIDPDGSRHEASRNGSDVVFDGLKPGGSILITYRTQGRAYGRLSGKFWGDQVLSSAYPTDELNYELLVPKGMEFDYKVTGLEKVASEPKRSTLDGRDLYSWKTGKHPGETPEVSSPGWSDIIATVHVTNVPDWAFIANWYSELTQAKVRPDDYVRKVTEELFAGEGQLTKRQEVEKIYDYITGNIRYVSVPFLQSNYIPQRAAKTLTTSQGDCKDVSSLFVAMCKLRSIPANLVLVSTRDRALTPLALPTNAFNHCIGRVELDGEPYYVELTDENLPFGMGDWSVNGAFALTIPGEGETFNGEYGPINPPSRKRNGYVREGTVAFDGDDMVFQLSSRYIGATASNLRGNYLYKSEEEQQRQMIESINGLYPRTELTELAFPSGLEGRGPEVKMDFTFRALDPGQKIAGLSIYDIKLFDRLTTPEYLATETREFPLDLWQTFYGEIHEQTVRVSAPEGKKLVEQPEDIVISSPYFDYSLTYAKDGTDLIIRRSFTLKEDLVAPEDYPTFRTEFQRVIAGDEIALAFR